MILLYQPDYYATLKTWWEGHDQEAPPEGLLGSLGAVWMDGTAPIAACFAWMSATNSTGIILFPVTDPAAPPLQTGRALHKVINFLEDHLQHDCERTHILYLTENERLASFYESRGGTLVQDQLQLFITECQQQSQQ